MKCGIILVACIDNPGCKDSSICMESIMPMRTMADRIINFTPYSGNDANGVLVMLSNHVDYTPELEPPENNPANIDYFKEVYLNEGSWGNSYVLKEQGTDHVLSFLEAKPHVSGNECIWYITSLFVEAGKNSDEYAKCMVDQFCRVHSDSDEVCANVHPDMIETAMFWESIGFKRDPLRTLFSNVDNRLLMAYSRKLVYENC